MGKQKKSGNKLPVEKIVFVTALFNLIEALIEIIKKLLE